MQKRRNQQIKLVVKAQRSMFTTEEIDQFLVYDEARTVIVQEPMRTDTRALFKPKEFKIFLFATLTPRGRLILGERAPNQDW